MSEKFSTISASYPQTSLSDTPLFLPKTQSDRLLVKKIITGLIKCKRCIDRIIHHASSPSSVLRPLVIGPFFKYFPRLQRQVACRTSCQFILDHNISTLSLMAIKDDGLEGEKEKDYDHRPVGWGLIFSSLSPSADCKSKDFFLLLLNSLTSLMKDARPRLLMSKRETLHH
jgi:hypothetical protein